ncbi:hypothetical protein TL16_g04944 [Triparma laevis f. inornata]|uniref:Uncharacterized protein n=2 Tax=Triparma laevis TaxID=1534972 RepID=A0A9W7CL21_9STRA|nr:hypothetical protein TL16_g04944 [Triparma laevis f. inornata]GMI07665.1 hypothetical protein TrLO_g13224 [Triparma laevis f. longispina]
MTERGMQRKTDGAKQDWETSTYPITCETCLGDNPYVRMTVEQHCNPCKICEKPFAVFRWKAGSKGRFKSTVICQACAKAKNVCQVCIFDLQYGLPVALRDKVLEEYGAGASLVAVPQSDANMNWDAARREGDISSGAAMVKNEAANAALMKMARKGPNYERNLPKLCSFFARGECNRGERCPFRHEKGREGEGQGSMDQDIRDRFYGKSAGKGKSMERYEKSREPLKPPVDGAVKTLWVAGLPAGAKEDSLRDVFEQYGVIDGVRIGGDGSFAFVEFQSRAGAELAAASAMGVVVLGKGVDVKWARGRGQQQKGLLGGEVAAGVACTTENTPNAVGVAFQQNFTAPAVRATSLPESEPRPQDASEEEPPTSPVLEEAFSALEEEKREE